MDRQEFVSVCDRKLKLVRAEYNFNQEKMGYILGISKKTIVEIEKLRSSLGWTGSVALCTIFPNSEVIQGVFGGKPTDIIMALAFDGKEPVYSKTLGGKVWWDDIASNGIFKIQRNVLSGHYRILDYNNRRICSGFDEDYIINRYEGLIQISK